MRTRFIRLGLVPAGALLAVSAFAQQPNIMYVGTLDQKLLMIDEDKGDIVGEIPLGGIPRTTVLSTDQTKLHIFTTKLLLETVDLKAKKVISSFSLSDGKSEPRMMRGSGGRSFAGVAVDPAGRYLYTTMKVTVKELDQYRTEPPQFVAIDLVDKKIAKSMPMPKGYDGGFGFQSTFKVSPDGKRLYVFDDDIVVFDLNDLKEVDRIALARPPYPGASPYRLAASDDPFEQPGVVTTVFTSVDPVVHKETLGLGKVELNSGKVDYRPIGVSFPMVGFMLSPDKKLGYSLMATRAGANRETEWWVWDLDSHKVIKKGEVPARPNFRVGMSSTGSRLYVYGSGSTIEFWDAQTLKQTKMLYLNKDTTTNLITVAKK
jgi:DNA-binding beta-propeller fold protein YncE